MGQAWTGTPIQQIGMTQGYNFLEDPQFQQAQKLGQQSPFAQNFNPEMYNQLFESGVANPVLKNYEERILPSITNQFTQPGYHPGSALNKAIGRSATDLASNLGSLRSNYLMQQQSQHATGQQNLMAQLLGLSQARAGQTQPILQEAQAGWLKDILNTLSQFVPEKVSLT